MEFAWAKNWTIGWDHRTTTCSTVSNWTLGGPASHKVICAQHRPDWLRMSKGVHQFHHQKSTCEWVSPLLYRLSASTISSTWLVHSTLDGQRKQARSRGNTVFPPGISVLWCHHSPTAHLVGLLLYYKCLFLLNVIIIKTQY